MNKWLGISLGLVFGVGHIGMISMIANRKTMPAINVPIGPYTAYTVQANKDGYTINYRANDPKIMRVERDVAKPGGFLGLGRSKISTKEQYTMDGAQHLESKRGGELSRSQIDCIKAEGGGESTGRIVGSSVGASVAPAVSSIPIVGWLAAGWVTMFGGNQGAEIGGTMARDLSGVCIDE